jgi:hypothetical protein
LNLRVLIEHDKRAYEWDYSYLDIIKNLAWQGCYGAVRLPSIKQDADLENLRAEKL